MITVRFPGDAVISFGQPGASICDPLHHVCPFDGDGAVVWKP
ncbi:MAG: hypothetical protein ABI835_15540 [Chloroflexota bacterium]